MTVRKYFKNIIFMLSNVDIYFSQDIIHIWKWHEKGFSMHVNTYMCLVYCELHVQHSLRLIYWLRFWRQWNFHNLFYEVNIVFKYHYFIKWNEKNETKNRSHIKPIEKKSNQVKKKIDKMDYYFLFIKSPFPK